MKTTCIIIVSTPTESGVNMLIVYGTLDIGDVPKSAWIENALPKPLSKDLLQAQTVLMPNVLFSSVLF